MQGIFDEIKSIWNFLNDFFLNLSNFFKDIFISLWDFVKDFFYWIFETITNVAVGLITSLDVSGIASHTGAFGSIPAVILNVCGLLHMGTCMAIIGSALVIRFILQLIPFVRFGS